MTREQAIQDVKQKIELLKKDSDHSGGYWDHWDALHFALERLVAGDDIEDTLGNI